MLAASDVTTTAGCWLIATPPTVAEIVLVSARVELSVPVATPFTSVGTAGEVRTLAAPVAARATLFPLITFPNWSRAVTMIVLWLEPVDAVTGLEAVTFVCVALTGPGVVNPVNVIGEPTPDARALCVLSVGLMAVPSVQLMLATPLALDTEVGALTDPPPSITTQLIVTPGTGLLRASATRTDSGVGRVWPTVSVCASPPFTVICVAPPTWPVALNVTVAGPPASVAVAVVVLVPGSVPRIRFDWARPSAPVVDDVGLTCPPPDAAAQAIETPGTGLPFASVIRTTSGVLRLSAT